MKRLPLATLAVALLLSACTGGDQDPGPSGPSSAAPSASASKELTVVVHESFSLPDELKAAFEEQTGYRVTYLTQDASIALVNQLVLTKDAPLGDAVYGIDNTSSARAVAEGVLADYLSPALTDPVPGLEPQPGLTPIDFGDVCINADVAWFEEKGLALPVTLDDLARPEYKDLLVVTSPASSSPGLAFLAATIGVKGEGWVDYWKSLEANGLKVASGWTEAYYTDFSGADGKGPRPLVLSYASSPAYTVTDGATTTTALPETCFRQVEYAGVLAGAENEAGARAFVDFLASPEVQAAIPGDMYMYPALATAELPEEWAAFAPVPAAPIELSAEELGANRDAWLLQWTDEIG